MKAMLVYVQETCKKLTNAMEDYAEKDEAFELKAQYLNSLAKCPDYVISKGGQMTNFKVSNFEYLLSLSM